VNVFKISKNDGPQEIYEVTFAVWLLTFDKEIAVQLDRKYKIIPTLVELAKTAVKEKVTRIVVAIFKVKKKKKKKEDKIDGVLNIKMVQ
jgi:V-type H+-transporting ATPase subunit H